MPYDRLTIDEQTHGANVLLPFSCMPPVIYWCQCLLYNGSCVPYWLYHLTHGLSLTNRMPLQCMLWHLPQLSRAVACFAGLLILVCPYIYIDARIYMRRLRVTWVTEDATNATVRIPTARVMPCLINMICRCSITVPSLTSPSCYIYNWPRTTVNVAVPLLPVSGFMMQKRYSMVE